MVVFERLKTMPDKEIQNWLRKVGRDYVVPLGIAMLGADETVKNCIFRNMSDWAGKKLGEDIEKNKTIKIDDKTIAFNAKMLENLM
jgi:flagellar motor switch protein FliG